MRLHKNEVHLAGVLARDPELRCTPTGKAVANFTISTTYEKHTEYHRCVAWEERAEKLGKNFHKGDYLKIVGRLQTRSWDDKQTGQKKYTTEVVIWEQNGWQYTPEPDMQAGVIVLTVPQSVLDRKAELLAPDPDDVNAEGKV
jgi:single stranded DNA-binding protein